MALLGWDQVWELFQPRTFFTMCSTVSSVRLNGRIAQRKNHVQIFVLKICTFPRLSSYCGQDLHECRTKYVEALQEVKMSKTKSEPKFAECQN